VIQLRPESPEELRKGLREMSNLELRRFGERARKLSDPKTNFGATEPHVVELEEAEGGMAQEASEIGMSPSQEKLTRSRRHRVAADAQSPRKG
jgi:hypothetical protein